MCSLLLFEQISHRIPRQIYQAIKASLAVRGHRVVIPSENGTRQETAILHTLTVPLFVFSHDANGLCSFKLSFLVETRCPKSILISLSTHWRLAHPAKCFTPPAAGLLAHIQFRGRPFGIYPTDDDISQGLRDLRFYSCSTWESLFSLS